MLFIEKNRFVCEYGQMCLSMVSFHFPSPGELHNSLVYSINLQDQPKGRM